AATPPPPPAQPRSGESLPQAIERTRTEIYRLRSELHAAQSAPPPADEVRAALRAHVETLARSGKPGVRFAPDCKLDLFAADVTQVAAPGGAFTAPSGSASKLFAAFFPERYLELLSEGLANGYSGGLPMAERPGRIAELEEQIWLREVEEESLIEQAHSA